MATAKLTVYVVETYNSRWDTLVFSSVHGSLESAEEAVEGMHQRDYEISEHEITMTPPMTTGTGDPNEMWRTMDSAPKDGRLVFAWRDGWDRPGFVRWAHNHRTGTEFWNDADEWDAYELESQPPTHWYPLPAVPKPLIREGAPGDQIGNAAGSDRGAPSESVEDRYRGRTA